MATSQLERRLHLERKGNRPKAARVERELVADRRDVVCSTAD
jgi:hypothetical protein